MIVRDFPSSPPPAEPSIPGGHERWRPSGFIAASLGLHAGALVSALAVPETWPWALGAVAVDQAVITLAGMLPRSRLLGPNWTRLPPSAAARGGVALTFDDGPDPKLTPWLLDRLDEAGCRASFFCIGEQARRHPGLCREIVARGHLVENHSLRHRLDFAFSGYRGFVRELAEAQAVLSDITGRPPRYFRAPFGIRNPMLEPALCRLGLRLASWTRRGYDTRESCPERVCRRLLRGLAAGDILLLHDAHSARMAGGEPVLREVLPRVLEALAAMDLQGIALPAELA